MSLVSTAGAAGMRPLLAPPIETYFRVFIVWLWFSFAREHRHFLIKQLLF